MSSALRNPAFLVSAAVLLASAGGLSAAVRAFKLFVRKEPVQAAYRCSSVPSKLPSWKQEGPDQRFTEDVQGTLGTDNYLTRMYVRDKGGERRVLVLHMAYYTGTIDTVPHVPDRCMVAGGMKQLAPRAFVGVPLDRSRWAVDDGATAEAREALKEPDAVVRTAPMGPTSRAPGTRVRLPRGIDGLRMSVSSFQAPDGGPVEYAGYFFIANGGLTPDAEGVRTLAFDLRSRYAYYLKVQVSTTSASSNEDLAAMAASLLDEVLPDICECVPDWTLVLRGEYPPDNPARKGRGAGSKG